MKKSSVLLGIDQNTEDTALFACTVKDESVIGTAAGEGARFVDMRKAIMTLPAKDAAFVSRVLFPVYRMTLAPNQIATKKVSCGIILNFRLLVSASRKGSFRIIYKIILPQSVKQGYSLLNWIDTMKFCPTCASPMTQNVSGTMLSCSKPCQNGKHHYPVTHPVAITRVVDAANEKVLLVRQPRHPRGMYSCVAGFMEAGNPPKHQTYMVCLSD